MTTGASFFPRDRGALASFALLAAGLALYLLLFRDAINPRSLAIRLSFLFYRPPAPFPPSSYGVLYAPGAAGPLPSLRRWNVESRWRKNGVISVVTP
jgi:hypothetical protein